MRKIVLVLLLILGCTARQQPASTSPSTQYVFYVEFDKEYKLAPNSPDDRERIKHMTGEMNSALASVKPSGRGMYATADMYMAVGEIISNLEPRGNGYLVSVRTRYPEFAKTRIERVSGV